MVAQPWGNTRGSLGDRFCVSSLLSEEFVSRCIGHLKASIKDLATILVGWRKGQSQDQQSQRPQSGVPQPELSVPALSGSCPSKHLWNVDRDGNVDAAEDLDH